MPECIHVLIFMPLIGRKCRFQVVTIVAKLHKLDLAFLIIKNQSFAKILKKMESSVEIGLVEVYTEKHFG